MKRRNVGSVMVVDAGHLVGIFTERDAVYRVMAEGRDAKTRQARRSDDRAPADGRSRTSPSATRC